MLEQMDQGVACLWVKFLVFQPFTGDFSFHEFNKHQAALLIKKEGGHQNEPVTAFVDFKSTHLVCIADNRNINPTILVHMTTVVGHANIFHVKPAVVVQVGAD